MRQIILQVGGHALPVDQPGKEQFLAEEAPKLRAETCCSKPTNSNDDERQASGVR